MHYLSFSRKTTMASLTVLALFLLSMILTSAHAQNNPFSATDLTGQSDMGFMELVVFVLVWVVRIVVISAMLFGAGKLLFSIFESIKIVETNSEQKYAYSLSHGILAHAVISPSKL